MSQSPLTVYKFGGTSVGAVDRFRRIVEIVTATAPEQRVVVVASALSQVTRQLSGGLEEFVTRLNGTGNGEAGRVLGALLETLRSRHLDQAEAVLSAEMQARYGAVVDERLAALEDTFEAVRSDGFTPARRDAVLAIGEQLSVPMVSCALQDAGLTAPLGDATRHVVTDDTFGEAVVRREETARRIRNWHASCPEGAVPVIAGFIGGTEAGVTTTLGFEGSDYSAALVAAILGADRLIRYTDVDGIYTDDPRTNAEATRIERITMEKAFAMTESGRLGMHPKTLRPLVKAGIPLFIRSIIEPEAPGTEIIPKAVAVTDVP